VIEDVPFVPQEERISVETLNAHFYRIKIFYGFKDEPNVPKALTQAYEELEFAYDLMQISFFISRDRIVHSVGDGMSPWRERLFISMQRNTSPVSDFYQIPTNRVVELGSQIEI
jgi:KUP system potassium uptake protein